MVVHFCTSRMLFKAHMLCRARCATPACHPLGLPCAALLLLLLVAGAAHSTGRHTARLEVKGCAGLMEPAAGDTAAPEGAYLENDRQTRVRRAGAACTCGRDTWCVAAASCFWA